MTYESLTRATFKPPQFDQGDINETCEEDTESSCMYVYFKTKDDGLAFLDRLNKYLVSKSEKLLAALAY